MLNDVITKATMEQQKLLERAIRERHTCHRAVSTLRLAETQFKALTTEVGDFVAHVMCEVGALTLSSALRRSAVREAEVKWERLKAK